MLRLPGVFISIAVLSSCITANAVADTPRFGPESLSATESVAMEIDIHERDWPTDCIANDRADRKCTPGDLMIDDFTGEPVTARRTCVPGYSRDVRNVPREKKNVVYSHYGITHHGPGDYDIDHLIPLKLGGSNDYLNLWPEPNPGEGDARAKQIEEEQLIEDVCYNHMPLSDAQEQIANNWSADYPRSFRDQYTARRAGMYRA